MNRTIAVCAALATAALLVTGCSSSDGDGTAEASATVDAAATEDAEVSAESEAPAEAEAPADSEGAPADVGDPATAACALLTDEEAQGLLEFEMTEAPMAGSLPQQGTSDCTWSAADGLDLRTIQTSLHRTEWIDPAMKENNPEASARWFWDLNTTEAELDGSTIPPLFDLTKPGPEGLGEASYYSPIGLCVLEGDDLYWCVSAGGLGADLKNPEAVAVMEQMAALVDTRVNG